MGNESFSLFLSIASAREKWRENYLTLNVVIEGGERKTYRRD
jgi:hypothetical protein